MKQYHIFHATSPLKFTETEIQPRKYVGFVEAYTLEEVFKLSQNGHSELETETSSMGSSVWNPTNPCRSTSVGDVIQDGNKFFMVCGTGFKELVEPKEEEDLATIADQQEESKYQQ